MKDEELFTHITELDDQRTQALLNADVDALEQYLGSSMRYVHGSGADEDRAAYLDKQRSGFYRYQKLESLRRECRRFGSTVAINGDIHIRVNVDGTDKDFTSRYLQLWASEADGWKMVAWQTTPLPVG